MLAHQRRLKILDLIKEEGSARVANLSKVFDVSEVTIRQDLEKLEGEGYVVREHGGAYLKSVPQQVKSFSLQHLENMDKKAVIGQKAASFVNDGDSLILDSGSTTTEVARNLVGRKDLRIITNALNIVLLLGAEYGMEIHMPGGEFKAPTLSLTGEKASEFFGHIHVDKLFLATGGISVEAGLTYPGLNDLAVKRSMVQASDKVYVLADSTKIGQNSFASLGGIDLTHVLITDNSISPEQKQAFEEKGVEVVVA